MDFTFKDSIRSAQAAADAARLGNIADAIVQLGYAVGQLARATELEFKRLQEQTSRQQQDRKD